MPGPQAPQPRSAKVKPENLLLQTGEIDGTWMKIDETSMKESRF